jgi:hypothetical protein
MEVIFEILLSVVAEILGDIADAFIGEFTWPDSKAGHICLGIIILFLGILIGRELH